MQEATAIITLDREDTIIGWSTGARALLGYLEQDVLGRPRRELCWPEEDGPDGSDVVVLRDKSGRKLRVARSATPLHDDAGRLVGYAEILRRAGAAQPTAGAKRREPDGAAPAALDPRVESLHLLLEHAPHGSLLVDERGIIAAANAALTSMFGYADPAELVGRSLEQLVPRHLRARHAEQVARYVEAPSFRMMSQGRELLAQRKDGSCFPAEIGLGAFGTERGRFVLATVLDRTPEARLRRVLEESESRFRQFTQTLPQLVWTTDGNGECEFLSDRWVEYTGVPAERQLGPGWLEQVHPDDRARSRAAWNDAVARGSDFHSEFRLRRHDGVYRWFDTRGRPVRDARGMIVKWFGASTDVHEALEVRGQLERERKTLEHIIETAPGAFAILRVTREGRMSCPRASPRIVDLFGSTWEELARDAAPAAERIHPEDRAWVATSMRAAARAGEHWRAEYRVRHPTRGELWVETYALPSRQEDGSLQWLGFARDVTERRRAEESLRSTQAQLTAALEAGGMGIWLWDTAREVLWMDDALLKLLGHTREGLTGSLEDVLACAHEGDRPALREALDKLAERPTELVLEYRSVGPDDNVRFLVLRGHSEGDESGKVVKVTGLNIEVTAQKRANEARLRSQKLEALGTLAGGIAHDFNNILQAMTGNAALAQRALEAEHPARGFLEEVSAASARAVDLVRRILTFSRPSEARVEAMALHPVIREALKLVRATTPAQIEIAQVLGEEPLHVLAEPTQIHQIVVNLTTNAAHAIGSRGGRIEVRLSPTRIDERDAEGAALPAGEYVQLEVRDDGPGIPPQTLGRIFDPFFTTKPVGQGTGLGLSVVHGLAKSLGGAVGVETELGRGTTFRLHLPRVSQGQNALVEPGLPAAAAGGQRVMYVDDEEVLVVLGIHILESLGYEAVGHSHAREALEEFRRDPARYDAVVTDVSMPVLSGFELARCMLELRADLPVIMMSGFVGPEEMERAERAGVRDLLVKPVRIEQLGSALARVFA